MADEQGRAAEGLLRQGDGHLARAEHRAAARAYAEALQVAPDRLEAWDRAVLAAYMQGETRQPEPQALLASEGAQVRLYRALAERARSGGLREAARAWLTEAERLAPDDASVLAARARLAVGDGALDQALAASQRALAAAPGVPDLHRVLFEVRLARGDVEAGCQEVLARLRPTLARDESGDAAALVAEAYIRQGLAPEEVRRRLASDTPHLRTAARKLVLARAYQRHYLSNPNWYRDAFDRVRGLVEEVRRRDSDALGAERLVAVRLLLEARRARLARFVERGDLEAAVAEAGQATLVASRLPPAERGLPADLHAERGRLLTLLGRPQDAMRAFEAAVRVQPGHRARLELARLEAGTGVTLLSAGQRQPALLHLRRAAVLHPEDDGILARLYQAQGTGATMQAVLACARLVREREIGTVFARLTHGLSQVRRPAEAAALVSLAGSLRLPPGRLAALRAEAARAAGRTSEARRLLLQALEHAPSSALWLRLAAVDAAAGRDGKAPAAKRRRHLVDALEATRHALALEPDGPALAQLVRLHTELAEAHLAAGDAARAEHFAAAVAVLVPRDPSVAVLLAEARLARARWSEARDACLAGLTGLARQTDPRHASLRLRLGRALRKLNRPVEAVEALAVGTSAAASPAPRQAAELWYELAFAHAAAAQPAESLSAARQYAHLAPHDPRGKARASEVQQLVASLTPTP
ncbi:MAG: hypothetical protein VKQ33_15920 [Candidatus Sericytochromatia bacterium]|nr:hypothetical protein [Candidatus Sericytochromatia bacterium]